MIRSCITSRSGRHTWGRRGGSLILNTERCLLGLSRQRVNTDTLDIVPLQNAWRAVGEKQNTHRLLKVGNEIVPVLGLLQTSKRHLGSGNVLLWVLEVLEKSLLVLIVSICTRVQM